LASLHLIHRLGFGWVARKRRERRSKYYSIERSAQKHLGNMCLIKKFINRNKFVHSFEQLYTS
ncbi:MAG TPA: hypothetical protein VE076_07255, partial [Nitrososphaeraceae archaeon]|nr:hypothetical protein [Nitrososphaeraceae archaeon]